MCSREIYDCGSPLVRKDNLLMNSAVIIIILIIIILIIVL